MPAAKPSKKGEDAARPAAKPKPKPKKKRKTAARGSARPSWFDWQTPDEQWKTRWALRLLLGVMVGLACWNGEIDYENGQWRAGLKNFHGQVVVGFVWQWGRWPSWWP